MKTIIQIVLWVGCIALGYLIYNSITGPIKFKEVKQERYSQVIAKLKDIRNAQDAYRTVNGKYANDFNSLIRFIDTGKYVITQQRDSSFMEFDKAYGIDLLKEVKIIDTLAFVSVKDSLFKKDPRYKTLMDVPTAPNGEKFTMKSAFVDKSGYRAPVFEVKVDKNVILYDQPKDLLARENAAQSVEEVNGSSIYIGSLEEVSTTGNWPAVYDKKKDQ
ncbi:hypothetical protein [uncultured Maribacter sp.]|uniref:hypothetical protein n=1 Tax=uncultured Maribacter sp. TaxID=431308 RepID=UPI0030EE2829|tara:strand:- start:25316 stop:25966 length:651 start_codon:yes stop_codon:yes gene_type:complete